MPELQSRWEQHYAALLKQQDRDLANAQPTAVAHDAVTSTKGRASYLQPLEWREVGERAALSFGHQGLRVKALQSMLAVLDMHRTKPSHNKMILQEEGKFGVRTQNAVIEFQKRNGLHACGIADGETFAVLEQSVCEAVVRWASSGRDVDTPFDYLPDSHAGNGRVRRRPGSH